MGNSILDMWTLRQGELRVCFTGARKFPRFSGALIIPNNFRRVYAMALFVDDVRIFRTMVEFRENIPSKNRTCRFSS